jgi:hypothetical protein
MPFTQKVKRFFPLSTAEGLGGLTIPAALQAWCSDYHSYHACAWHGQQACPTAEFSFIDAVQYPLAKQLRAHSF